VIGGIRSIMCRKSLKSEERVLEVSENLRIFARD